MRRYYKNDSYIEVTEDENGLCDVIENICDKVTVLAKNIGPFNAATMAMALWKERYSSEYMFDDFGREYRIDDFGQIHWTYLEG